MNPRQIAAVVLGALIALGGAIIVVSPASLGLSPTVANWIGVVLVALGPIQAALQSDRVVQTLGLDPK